MIHKGQNVPATAMRWFPSDNAHFCLHPYNICGESVHIFMVRSRVTKSCSMADLCFHCFLHFGYVLIYIFVRFTSQIISSVDESLKDETRLLMLWDRLLVTLHTVFICIYINIYTLYIYIYISFIYEYISIIYIYFFKYIYIYR